MGLNASVMCRCFIDGRVESPLPGLIKFGEEGHLLLELPYDGNGDQWRLFYQWRDSGCKHPRMNYAFEGFNWTAYRSFQQALEIAGFEHFPTLRTELPQNNGGLTEAAAAPRILEELSFFAERADVGWRTVLVDTDTAEELQHYIASYAGEFDISPSGYDFGIDQNGFFISSRADGQPKKVFQAMRVEQIMPGHNASAAGGQPMVDFVDLDSGLRYSCVRPMIKILRWPDGKLQNEEGQIRIGYPLRMHVITRRNEASDFEAVVSSLRALCHAAIETANPIRWS